MKDSISIFEIEKYLIDPKDWKTCGIEEKQLLMVEEESGEGQSTGIAKHPEYGFFVLGAGQGPFMIWSEKGYEWDYYSQCIILNKNVE